MLALVGKKSAAGLPIVEPDELEEPEDFLEGPSKLPSRRTPLNLIKPFYKRSQQNHPFVICNLSFLLVLDP